MLPLLEFRRVLFRSDRKSTRLNSSHGSISYAVFCLKKKNTRLNYSHRSISYAVFYFIRTKLCIGCTVIDIVATAVRRLFVLFLLFFFFFFFNDTATTEIYTLSLHDALPIYISCEAAYPPNTSVARTD